MPKACLFIALVLGLRALVVLVETPPVAKILRFVATIIVDITDTGDI